MNADEIINAIENLTVLELVELTRTIKQKWAITTSNHYHEVLTGPPSTILDIPACIPEDCTAFTAVLTEVGPNKIAVIKVVREFTSLGLREAKALVEDVPKTIQEEISKYEFDKIAAKFKAVGATIQDT